MMSVLQDRVSIEKTPENVKDMVFLIARLASGFEALLKQEEPYLSITQIAILETLSKDGQARPIQLARRLATSRQIIQAATKRLNDAGYVTYVAADRAAVVTSITSEGRKMLESKATIYHSVASSLNESRSGMSLASTTKVLKAFGREREKMNHPRRA